jgi:carbamoyltransferase
LNALGVHWTVHDNAAALVVDGEVVAAVEEERLTRQKHGPWVYPRRAVAWCLAEAGLDARALDVIAIDFSPAAGALGAAVEAIGHGAWKTLGAEVFRRGWTALAPHVVRRHIGGRARSLFIPHQLAHVASVWFPSEFDHAAVLVVDGMGDFSSAAIFEVRDRAGRPRFERRWANRFPHSLGLVYAALTAYLGFRPFADEYKVMGLAGYGRDRYRDELEGLIPLMPDGSFTLDHHRFTFRRDYSRLPFFDRSLEDLLGPRRAPAEPLCERHADIAASLQARLERVMLALADKAQRLVGARDLCVAGGVALNCAMNGRLRRDGPFRRVFCAQAPHDGGGALGAALVAASVEGGDEVRPYPPFLGPGVDEAALARAIDTSMLPSAPLPDPPAVAARLLAAGHFVGWMQGRLELGPRALGNRSILADPRDAGTPGRLNRDVKQREEFRPFAPAVLEERANDLFEIDGRSPYMQFAVPVRPHWRGRIPAVVHVDGTARVQTVSAADNPLLRRVLESFERSTGVPCVLNTSLNSHGEPIAAAPEDALSCFGRTGLRFLIIGNRLVTKSERDLQTALGGA